MRKPVVFTVLMLSVIPSFSGDAAELVLRDGRFYTVVESGFTDDSLSLDGGRIVLVGGEPEEGWRAMERRSRLGALRGFALDAAYSPFLKDEIDSIEVGERADLVVFDGDPMTAPVADIPAITVDLTVVDGEIALDREDVK